MADEPGRTSLPRLSRLMAWCSTTGAIIVPLAVVVTFLFPTVAHALDFRYSVISMANMVETPFAFRVAALVLALLPTGFMVWALVSLRRLFLLYAAGEVFSHQSLRMLNHVAAALFVSVIANFVTEPPITLILSWYRGAGHRSLALGIGSDDVIALFLAGAVLVIARVMAEARRMADENAGFV